MVSLILILTNVFLWGAVYQLLSRELGYAEEALGEAAPGLATPARAVAFSSIILILTIIFIVMIYIPLMARIIKEKTKTQSK